MSVIEATELIPGEVYVTRGGTVIMKGDSEGKKLPWGYERVRFMKLTETHIIVETPWETECELPLDYPLSSTSEAILRSEFPIRGVHELPAEVIPFEEALKLGISKELSAEELQEVLSEQAGGQSTKRPSEVARNEFTEKFIKYFEEEHTFTEGAKHFGTVYQRIRYTLNKLKLHGYGLQRFQVETTKGKPAKVKLVRI